MAATGDASARAPGSAEPSNDGDGPTPEGRAAGPSADEPLVPPTPTERALSESNAMLKALADAQTRFLVGGDPRETWGELLDHVLRLTGSAYGFIGEVERGPDGAPAMRAHAITDIAWSPETRALYQQHHTPAGMRFERIESLYGVVLTSGQPVIANDPARDPRRGGLPHGHPSLDSFLGLPLHRGAELVGMIGVANRVGGYDAEMVRKLAPFVATCAALVEAQRNDRRRREADEKLAEARGRLESALDAGGIGTWTADPTAERFGGDERVARLFGRGASELQQVPMSRLVSCVHAEDRDGLREAFAAARRGQAASAECRVSRPDGTVTWVAFKGRLERDGRGEARRMVGACVDITERRRLEEQLRQAQKMDAIGQLAGGVAHDFNNLLTVISGNVTALARSLGQASADTRETIAEIAQAADRAAALTRQLLTVSRRQPLRLRPLDVNEVVGRTTRLVQRLLGEDVALEVRLAASLPPIHGDEAMLEQVVINLVVNARDAMPSGGELVVSTSYVERDRAQEPFTPDEGPSRCVCLTVSDNGVGIAPEHMPRLFEPFFTTKEVGKGTGLGLATVYGIVKQHRGAIRVASTEGQGTTFSVLLPALRTSDDQSAVVAGPRAIEGGDETILVVEDEELVRKLVCRVLEAQGYRVLSAGSGPEALAVWAEEGGAIDALLTDVVMPHGMSGDALAERLRAERPDLKVILTSGYSPELVRRSAATSAPDQPVFLLQKPYAAEQLALVVRQALDGTPPDEST